MAINILCVNNAFSQIQPSFTISRYDGCVPLLVEFSNTTPVNLNNVEVHWDFGNGNQSIEKKNTQAAYNSAGVFNITLTIKQNGVEYKKTQSIEVYGNPKADFSADIFSGCLPLKVQFTDLSIPTQNPIVSWVWNFGDGSGDTAQNPRNTYLSDSKNNVTLVVIDSKGCKDFIVKNELIVATEQPIIDFSYSDTITCKLPLNISFNGLVSSSYPTTVHWDFGNGSTSDLLNPTTKYSVSKLYVVKLTAENIYNCKNELIKDITILEEPFLPQIISVKNQGCVPFKYSFKATANMDIESYKWEIGSTVKTDSIGDTTFSTPGTYYIKLTAKDKSNCSRVVRDTVIVYPEFVADFQMDKDSVCAAPLNVNFKSLAPSATSHLWTFSNGVSSSTDVNPTILFNKEGTYNVRYIASNTLGCTDTILKAGAVFIGQPTLEILATNEKGCIPFETDIVLMQSGPGKIKNISWDLGEGLTYQGLYPPKVNVQKEGNIIIQATVEFEGNCPSQVVQKVISGGVLKPFKAKIQPTTLCVKEGLSGQITNPDNETTYKWYFGDGGMKEGVKPTYEYSDPGKFDVYVVSEKNGCKDSVYIQTISILNPSAAFTVSKACNSGGFVFKNTSVGQDYSRWDFGDGYHIEANDKNITHVFADTGTFQVKLYVENYTTKCKDSITVEVINIDEKSSLGLIPQVGCLPYTASFNVSSTDYKAVKWNFNGTEIVGRTGTYTYKTPGIYDVTVYLTKQSGCVEEFKFPKLVTVVDYQADFDFNPIGGCAPIEVTFTDKTHSDYSKIKSWNWKLGSKGIATTKQATTIFNINQDETIRLITTDNYGCKDTIEKNLPIFIPKADFTSQYQSVCTDVDFSFIDTSLGVGLQYNWSFGDGSTSTDKHPIKSFAKEGQYDVKLLVTDANNCQDSIIKIKYVKVENFDYDFDAYPRFKTCPELSSNFEIIPSNITYKRAHWDFGDGNQSLDTNRFPVNIYTKSGIFDVRLIVEDFRGCKDTVIKDDFITVKGPRGKMSFNPTTGCLPLEVNFQAEFQDSKFNFWDYGTGVGWLDNSLQTSTSYVYNEPGIAIPSLILDDGFGCIVHLFSDTIVVSGVKIKMEASELGICSGSDVLFEDVTDDNIYSPIINRTWEFSNGIKVDNQQSVLQKFEVDSTQLIFSKLTIETQNGCIHSDSIPIKIYAYPKVLTIDDRIICKGDDVILSAEGSDYYDWEPKRIISQPNSSHPKVSPIEDTWFFLTAYDTSMCKVNDSVFVKVVKSFDASAFPDTVVCYGDSVQLRTLVSEIHSGSYNYTWSLAQEILGQNDSLGILPEKDGTYIVHIQNGSCNEYFLPVFVGVSYPPQLEAFRDTTIANGQSVVLNAVVDQNVLFQWSPNIDISCTNCPHPIVSPKATTEYTVVARNEFGCEDEARVTVGILDYCSNSRLKIPNVFTPNQDGLNDVFKIQLDKDLVLFNQLRIYNRHGELVFQTTDPNVPWDGLFNGMPVNPGVFVYYLDLNCYNGLKSLVKGNVTVLR
ncbi:MAG: PKD domain-containing protein [Chitinophagales bacterium]|nr:PKD domain-containing protein [Chitinophagales bacterium]MCZ2394759.1 PKD domain-containing protein [Chitinophagales bacterium]